MKDFIAEQIAALQASAESLHQETDELNALYEQINDRLRGVNVAFWWTDYKIYNHFVGFDRCASGWCLAARSIHDEDDIKPLCAAPRAVRVSFSGRVQAFLTALIEAVEKERDQVRAAKQSVTKAI